MKKYTPEELKKILENHKLWLDGIGTKVDLSCANLSDADLSGADLRYANLSDADLRDANLRCANLSCANLSCANLRYANLSCANLRDADLRGSNFDFTGWTFSCKTLFAKIDKKIITQLLYHAAIPTQNNVLEIDEDITELFSSDIFKKVVNKFHRVEECGKFEGVKK